MEQIKLGNGGEDQKDRKKKESVVESREMETIYINENKENENRMKKTTKNEKKKGE